MAAAYLGSVDARDQHASPLYADLTGLPPLYMLVGTSEVLYDDTIRTAAKARAAGVDVRVEEGPDLPHVYPRAHWRVHLPPDYPGSHPPVIDCRVAPWPTAPTPQIATCASLDVCHTVSHVSQLP
jgi:acetyl esterase/lipase